MFRPNGAGSGSGAVTGFLAVAHRGVRGARPEGRLEALGTAATFQTAVAVPHVPRPGPGRRRAAVGRGSAARGPRSPAGRSWSGSLIFSGSLYVLSLTGLKWLGAITPIGGVAFLVGWAALAVAAPSGRRGNGRRPVAVARRIGDL